MAREITYYIYFEISLEVFMPNITRNRAITYTNYTPSNTCPSLKITNWNAWQEKLCSVYFCDYCYLLWLEKIKKKKLYIIKGSSFSAVQSGFHISGGLAYVISHRLNNLHIFCLVGWSSACSLLCTTSQSFSSSNQVDCKFCYLGGE